MIQRVSYDNTKKYQRVFLEKELPVGLGYGNKYPLKKELRGDIISDGFESGKLKVSFYSHFFGTQIVEFDGTRAREYLLTDV